MAGLLLAGSCAAATLPFHDDFESGLANWSPGGSWGLTTAHYASPGHCVTDSPGSFYTNNTDAALALAVSLDLSGAVRPALSFQHQYALEAGYDFGYVEVSTNGGSAWLAPAVAAYTGNPGVMSREQLDLSAYAGVTALRLRFRIVTDSSVVMDGWYVDDVRVAEAPAPVTLWVTQTNRNSVALAWGQSASPGFASYRLYRSLNPGVDWHTARLVAEITSNSITNVTDIAASPKSRYYYRLGVVNTDGMVTLGNEIAVTTLAGMDYPFVDNGEGGGGTWIPDAPWALSDEDADSPNHAWSDSPGTNYANGIASQSLMLAAPLFLDGPGEESGSLLQPQVRLCAGRLGQPGGLNQLRRGLDLAGGLHRDGDEHVAAGAHEPERLHQRGPAGAIPHHHRLRRNSRWLAPGRHLGGGIAGRGPGANPGQCHVPQHPHLLGGEHEHSVLLLCDFPFHHTGLRHQLHTGRDAH